MVDLHNRWQGAYYGKAGVLFEESYFLFKTTTLCARALSSAEIREARVLWHHAAHVDDMRVEMESTQTYSQLKSGCRIKWHDVRDDFDQELKKWSGSGELLLELVNDSRDHVDTLRKNAPKSVQVEYHPPGGYGSALFASEDWLEAVAQLFPMSCADEIRAAKIGLVSAATRHLTQGSKIGAILDYLARVDHTCASWIPKIELDADTLGPSDVEKIIPKDVLILAYFGDTISYSTNSGDQGVMPFKVGSDHWKLFVDALKNVNEFDFDAILAKVMGDESDH